MLTLRNSWQSLRRALTRSVPVRTDPNTPVALYFEPNGTVRALTMKSFMNGEYNALNASMNRSNNATATEIGYEIGRAHV